MCSPVSPGVRCAPFLGVVHWCHAAPGSTAAAGIVISGLTLWASAPLAAAKACGGFDGVSPSTAVLHTSTPEWGNADDGAVLVSRFPDGWRAWEQLH